MTTMQFMNFTSDLPHYSYASLQKSRSYTLARLSRTLYKWVALTK